MDIRPQLEKKKEDLELVYGVLTPPLIARTAPVQKPEAADEDEPISYCQVNLRHAPRPKTDVIPNAGPLCAR